MSVRYHDMLRHLKNEIVSRCHDRKTGITPKGNNFLGVITLSRTIIELFDSFYTKYKHTQV